MIKENIPSLEEMYNSRTVGTGKITYEFNKPTMSQQAVQTQMYFQRN